MGQRTFTKQELDDLDLPGECNGGEVVSDVITGNSRWSIEHTVIFRLAGQADSKAWRAHYQVGATEAQGEGPWEYQDEVTATEVALVERTVKVWEPVAD